MWAIKILAKIILSRLPINYSFWSKVNLFRHGSSDDPSYAYKVFDYHYRLASPPPEFTVMELGPGDAISSAVIAYAFGSKESFHSDVGDFANKSISIYQNAASYCKSMKLIPPNIDDSMTFEEILRICNAHYMTDGIKSLRSMKSNSVDFIYSQSCLEHIRLDEFEETLRETKRILKPGGTASHSVDFKDHLDYGLNNLRFPERVWESNFFADSGFYTNRIRPSKMISMMNDIGFSVEIARKSLWDSIPTPRTSMHSDFSGYPDDDLLINSMVIICK